MSELYENIKSVCEAHGESVSGVALKSGISKSTLSQLKKGVTQTLNTSTLQKMADYLNEPVSVFLEQKKEPAEIDRLKNEIMTVFRGLDDEGQKQLLAYARFLAQEQGAE